MQAIHTAVIAEIFCQKHKVEIVVAKTDSKNSMNSQFEPGAISFHSMQFEFKPVKTEEPERNKFFNKPRNNFKKR